jgi:hypothetical protein
MMVSAFHVFSSVTDSQTVWISQMNHLAVEENAKLMNGSVGKSHCSFLRKRRVLILKTVLIIETTLFWDIMMYNFI